MGKYLHTLPLMVFLLLLLSSCSPTYYVPNTSNVPLLSEKGETKISAMFGSVLDHDYELQIAHSPVDNIGLIGNFYYGSETSTGKGDGQFVELGAGYYTTLSERDYLLFETYALLGAGRVVNSFSSSDKIGELRANAARIGIQPAIGLKIKWVEIALSGRVAFLNFFNVTGDLRNSNDDSSYVERLRRNNQHILIEPGLTLRAGLKNVKLQGQYLLSYPIVGRYSRFEDMRFSVGIIASF